MMNNGKILASVVVVLAAAGVNAVETAFYTDRNTQDFSAGEKENVYISEDGQLLLAAARTVVLEGVDYVWCAAVAPDGTVYAGTLPGGKVYRAAQDKSEVLYDTGEAGVFSLLVARDDAVIAGTGPAGRIFKVSPDGTGSLLATLDAQYVFGLAAGQDGTLFAATGGNAGRVYRIQADKPEVLFESPSAQLTALAIAPDGSIYATSGDRGAVYRIGPDGKSSVVFCASQRVVQDVAIASDGSVYAATASIADEKTEEEALRSLVSEIQARRQDPGTNPAPPAPPARRTYKVANSLYRIAPDGKVQTVFTLNGALILSVLAQGDRVLCSTGGQAGVFAINPATRETAKLFESKSEHVLDLAAGPSGGFVAAMGMPGQAVRFDTGYSRMGTFTSRVLDSKGLTGWGKLTWVGQTPTGTSTQFAVRSGNTPTPDTTWVDWRKLDGVSGSADTGLPFSRYVQYKIDFATASPEVTPRVREVTLAGLSVNLPPVVLSISAGRDQGKQAAQGAQAPRDASDAKEGAQQTKPQEPAVIAGTANVYWKAEDPNGDKLVFSLEFKEASMSRFIKLDEDLAEARYSWDTSGVPDGRYYLRVTASDRPSNPAGSELQSAREEGLFVVDNTPPVLPQPVVAKTDTGYSLELDAVDATGPLAAAWYSVDGGKWEVLPAADGIFDSAREKIVIRVKDAAATIAVVKVVDRAGNSSAVIAALK